MNPELERLLKGTAEAPTMFGEVAANDAETGLAYSVDYPPTGREYLYQPEPQGHPGFGSAVAKAVAAVLAVSVGAAVVLLFVLYHKTVEIPSASVSTSITTTTVTAPSARAAPIEPDFTQEPAQVASDDERYLKLFSEFTSLQVTDPIPVIALGHAQCEYLSQPGNTPSSAATALLDRFVGWPGHPLTREMVYGIVQASVMAYCPQFRKEL